jgi:hypothetical protein
MWGEVQYQLDAGDIMPDIDGFDSEAPDFKISPIQLSMRQFNACTLGIPGARKAIASQLAKDRVQIAFFQEGCSRKSGVFSRFGYIMVQSAREGPGMKGC